MGREETDPYRNSLVYRNRGLVKYYIHYKEISEILSTGYHFVQKCL